MRKTLLLSSLLLLCGLWVMAQTSPSSSQTSPSSSSSSTQSSTSGQSSTMGQSSSAEHHTKVKGCLNGSSGNYTLTDSKSGKTYQLSGDTSKLTEHVGHTVEITGTKASPTSGSSASTSSAAGTASTETLDVISVKHISPTCSSGSSSGMSH